MKRYRPYCAGYIVLYVLTLLCLGDVVYTVYRQTLGIENDYMAGFSFFSYLIFAMALGYTWMYVRAQVAIDGKTLRMAWPANIRPKAGEGRAFILYRQGDLDLKFIDKTIRLEDLVRYGYVEDLGYERIDRSQSTETSKLFPVREVAFITRDNRRYHLNLAVYSKKQQAEILEMIRQGSGVEAEGELGKGVGR